MIIAFRTAKAQEADTLLSLYSIRAMALTNSNDIRVADLQILAAGEREEANRKDFFPRLDAGAVGLYNYQQTGTEGEVLGNEWIYNVSAVLTQPIYLGNSTRLRVEQARAFAASAAAGKSLTETEVIYLADITYWTAVSFKEQAKATREYTAFIEDLISVTADRVEAEIVNQEELLNQRVQLNSANLLVSRLENAYRIAKMDINRVMGRPIETVFEVVDSIAYEPAPVPEGELNDLALAQRPEIAVQESNIAVSQMEEKLVLTAYRPSISASARPSMGNGFVNDGDNFGFNFIAYAGVHIPILRWGKKHRELAETQLRTQINRVELEKLEQDILLEVSKADAQLEEALEQIELTSASLDDAKENLRIITDRYESEIASVTDVLLAQLYYQNAFLQFLDAKKNYKFSETEILKSLGELSLD
jgi:outer membrane protein TolC